MGSKSKVRVTSTDHHTFKIPVTSLKSCRKKKDTTDILTMPFLLPVKQELVEEHQIVFRPKGKFPNETIVTNEPSKKLKFNSHHYELKKLQTSSKNSISNKTSVNSVCSTSCAADSDSSKSKFVKLKNTYSDTKPKGLFKGQKCNSQSSEKIEIASEHSNIVCLIPPRTGKPVKTISPKQCTLKTDDASQKLQERKWTNSLSNERSKRQKCASEASKSNESDSNNTDSPSLLSVNNKKSVKTINSGSCIRQFSRPVLPQVSSNTPLTHTVDIEESVQPTKVKVRNIPNTTSLRLRLSIKVLAEL